VVPDTIETDNSYSYDTVGRNWTTLITTAVVWVVLLTLILVVDMVLWLAGIVFLFTLPAVYDLITARASGLAINAQQIAWHAGKQNGDIAKRLINHIRLDTRLDLSVRCTVVLYSGQKIKIPFESCPKHQELEKTLHTFEYKTLRQHFGFI
jgi:hypothetical protein